MKYDLIITGQLFQLVNVQDAHISLPISRTIPIIIIAVVAPAKIAINPIIEYHAATVLMASAVSNVSNPKNTHTHLFKFDPSLYAGRTTTFPSNNLFIIIIALPFLVVLSVI